MPLHTMLVFLVGGFVKDDSVGLKSVRSWAGRLGLVVAGGVLAALLAEAVLRTLHLAPIGAPSTVTERELSRVPGMFSPNQRIVGERGTVLEHRVTIDSLGFRGNHLPRQKPEGQVRIVFAGDSFTWGKFVDDQYTLPAQLEKRLTEACGDARVINAGVTGFSILGETQVILRTLELEPDLVVLMFYENDIVDLLATRMWDQLAANRQAKSQFPFSLVYRAVRGTALWNLALDARQTVLVQRRTRSVQDGPGESRRDLSPAQAEYRRHLVALRDSLAQRKIALALLAFPAYEAIRNGVSGDQHSWAVRTADSLGLPVLDLFDPLQRAGPPIERLYLVPRDAHASAEGYAIAAAAAASFVIDGGHQVRCRS